MPAHGESVGTLVAEIGEMLERRGAWCTHLGGDAQVRKGLPRIVASYGGRFIALAVKAPRGPGPTSSQRRELAALDRSGAVTVVARSVVEVEAILDDLDRNPPEILALERIIA